MPKYAIILRAIRTRSPTSNDRRWIVANPGVPTLLASEADEHAFRLAHQADGLVVILEKSTLLANPFDLVEEDFVDLIPWDALEAAPIFVEDTEAETATELFEVVPLPPTKARKEHGAVEGILREVVNMHGRQMAVQDVQTQHKTLCILDAPYKKALKDHLGERIRVSGWVDYRDDGKPERITVYDYQFLPAEPVGGCNPNEA